MVLIKSVVEYLVYFPFYIAIHVLSLSFSLQYSYDSCISFHGAFHLSLSIRPQNVLSVRFLTDIQLCQLNAYNFSFYNRMTSYRMDGIIKIHQWDAHKVTCINISQQQFETECRREIDAIIRMKE